jgi:hypothetical protein
MNSTNVSQNTNAHNNPVLDRELDELSKAQSVKATRSAELKARLAELSRIAKIAKDEAKAEYMVDGIEAEDEKITALIATIETRKAKLQAKVNEYRFTGKLVNAVSFSG